MIRLFLENYCGLSKTQSPYFQFWIITLLIVEGTMLVLNTRLVEIYSLIATLFLGGFLLRSFKVYPGQSEPLVLDLSGVILALLFAIGIKYLGTSNWRFLVILCSSIIIFPHFLYILREK